MLVQTGHWSILDGCPDFGPNGSLDCGPDGGPELCPDGGPDFGPDNPPDFGPDGGSVQLRFITSWCLRRTKTSEMFQSTFNSTILTG